MSLMSRTFLLISKRLLAPSLPGFGRIFCKEPDGKYFRLCRRFLSQLFSSVVVTGEQP